MRLSASRQTMRLRRRGGYGLLAQRILLALLLVNLILPSFAAIHASSDGADILAPEDA